MTTDIKKLLNKRKWTGAEVGKILLASLLNDIENKDEDSPPLLTQEKFSKMEKGIETKEDYLTYSVYKSLNRSITNSYNRNKEFIYQFNNGYLSLLRELENVERSNDIQKDSSKYPLIVTEIQYKRLKSEARKNKSEYNETLNSIIFHILDYALTTDSDDIPKSILEAIEATKREPAKDSSYINLYNSVLEIGYYVLPDGRKSNEMTDGEWQDALEKAFKSRIKNSNIEEAYRLFFSGAEGIRKAYKEIAGKSIRATDSELLEAMSNIIDNVIDRSNNSITAKLETVFGFTPLIKWYSDNTPPKKFTQYNLLYIYIYINKQNGLNLTEQKRLLKDFKKNFLTLYDALITYIQENIPQAKRLNYTNFFEDLISWQDLEKLNILSYKNITEPTDIDIINFFFSEQSTDRFSKCFSKCFRIFYNKIAIIQNPHDYQTDRNGNYIEEINYLAKYCLYGIVSNDEKMEDIKSYQYNYIMPALSYRYAFNTLMHILENVYDIKGLGSIATLDTISLERKVEEINSMIYKIYYEVYGGEEEKEYKRELIKDIFQPIDVEMFKPSQEAITEVTEELYKLGFTASARIKLNYIDNFILELMARG